MIYNCKKNNTDNDNNNYKYNKNKSNNHNKELIIFLSLVLRIVFCFALPLVDSWALVIILQQRRFLDVQHNIYPIISKTKQQQQQQEQMLTKATIRTDENLS